MDKYVKKPSPPEGEGRVRGNALADVSDTPHPGLPPQGGKEKQEIGGRGGLDPTRYNDYEINGKCVDF